MRILAAVLPLLLPSCTTVVALERMDAGDLQDPIWTSIRTLAEVRQVSDNDCGAACLAMVLRYWNQPVDLREVSAAIPLSSGNGMKVQDMVAYVRSKGLGGFWYQGTWEHLDRHLEFRQPVIAGTTRLLLGRPIPHYVVVVGRNKRDRRIATMDPARGLVSYDEDDFEVLWSSADHLVLVAAPLPSK